MGYSTLSLSSLTLSVIPYRRYPVKCSVITPLNSTVAPLSSSDTFNCSLNCPHFQSCSGCTQEYNLHRPIILEDVNEFFRKHGVHGFRFDSCKLYGWRCRAKLAVRGSSTNPLVGLYEEGTHNIVDIPECKAHHPNINAAVELLKRGMKELNIEPYDEDEGTGELRYVQMAVTTHDTSLPSAERYKNGKVQVSLVWNSRNETSPSSEKLNALANFLWGFGGPNRKFHLIHSVWANFQTSNNNRVKNEERTNVHDMCFVTPSVLQIKIIFGNRWRHIRGERDFWEHVGGVDVFLAPSSFAQANTRAFDSLLQKLHKYVHFGDSVADVYAGAGVIGLSLAATKKCKSVKCIEINKESKLSFEKTAERLPKFIDSNISWHNADASVDPLSWMVGTDVVVVDPPRKGLDSSLLNALCTISSIERKNKPRESQLVKAKDEKRPWIIRAQEASVQIPGKTEQEESQSLPQTILYISCGWESFKQDCASLLSNKEWRLEKAHGFNLFPGTRSIEVLAVFKRGSSKKLKKSKVGKKKKKNSL